MTEAIEIYRFGPMAKIKGPFPLALVRELTSYPVEGAEFSPSYRKGQWDGRKHLFDKRSQKFPTGLTEYVKAGLEEEGHTVHLFDFSEEPEPKRDTEPLIGVQMTGKYSYQQDCVDAMIRAKQGIVKAATGAGKCLGEDTPIRMFDGTVKAVQDIVEGDLLMGPDSKPRRVMSTCVGVGPLFRISQRKGMSYVCNDAHVLTLQDTSTALTQNEVVDIPLNKYLEKSSDFKHRYKHFSVAVDYPECSTPLDPYLFGMWVGDGTKSLDKHSRPAVFHITTVDKETTELLRRTADLWETNISDRENREGKEHIHTWALTTARGQPNPLLEALRSSVSDWTPFLINSKEKRMEFLAGLIDSDGHYDGKGYSITQKSRDYIDKIYSLVRSLGWGCALPVAKVVRGTTYWRLYLGAPRGEKPPCKLKRKQCTLTHSHSSRTSFSVEEIGEGTYYGFTLDGDGRFLLEDYTVTHNTFIAIAYIKYLGLPTMYMVSTKELIYQARKSFKELMGLGDKEIGVIGDGVWEPGTLVTIVSPDTLVSRRKEKYCKEFLESVDVMFADECHNAGSDTWHSVMMSCPAFYRFAMSGTPVDRTDGANMRLIGTTGEIVFEITNAQLVDLFVIPKADIIFDAVTEPLLPTRLPYQTVYKEGTSQNAQQHEKVLEWVKVLTDLGLSTLVLVEEIAHGKRIDDDLWTKVDGRFIPHQFISGKETGEVRAKAIEDFSNREVPVLVSSSLPYEELVLVRHLNTRVELVEIGDFVDNLYAEHEYECWTRNADGKDCWQPVTGVVAHPRNGVPLVETRLRSGVNVVTTENHALIGDDYAPTLPREGGNIHAALSCELDGEIQFLDLAKDLLPLSNVQVEVMGARPYHLKSVRSSCKGALKWLDGQRGSSKETNARRQAWVEARWEDLDQARADCEKYLSCTHNTGKKTLARKESSCEDYDYLERIGVVPRLTWRRSNGGSLPIKMAVTEDLALLAGVFVAEGCTHSRATVAQSSIAAMEDCPLDTREGFSDKAKIREFVRKALQQIDLPPITENSIQMLWRERLVYHFFQDVLRVGGKADSKRVPDFVWNSTPSVREAFLFGHFLGDGHRDHGRAKSVNFITVSRPLAVGIHYLLMSLGKKCSVTHDKIVRSPHTNSTGRTVTPSHKKFVVRCQSDIFGYELKKTRDQPTRELTRAISSVQDLDRGDETVYDLSVAGVERFYAGFGVCAHNTILDEGVSINSIDALVLAGSKKSKIRTLQRLGRGLRGKRLIVVEFANMCHKFLIEHSLTRLADYEAEKCFPIHNSSPDKELVAKLWEAQWKRYEDAGET